MVQPGTAPQNPVRGSAAAKQTGAAQRPRCTTAVFFALFAAALAPVLWFGIPAAMVDYPNHLARMFILSRSNGADPNPFYQVTWALYPNLAMDLLVPPLGRLIGVEVATRLFYLAGQILVITGVMAIEGVVKGRIAIAGFFSLMFLYSPPFAWGFVNFEFALGCAFWGIAAALLLQQRRWPARLALHGIVISWLFVAHLFALGIYGFTIGVHELWRARQQRAAARDLVGRLAIMALPTLLLMAVSMHSHENTGGSGTQWFFQAKPLWVLHITNGYSLAVSAFSILVTAAALRTLAWRGALSFESSGAWLAVGFALLFLAMPFRIFDGTFVDLRVIVAAALILPAFVSISFPNPMWRRGALAGAAAITVINVVVVLNVWVSYRADYAALKDSFRILPKHAMILVGHSGDGQDPPRDLTEFPIYHAPTLAVHYADALVSDLFAEPGKQPIEARTPWQRFNTANADPVPVNLLKAIAERGAPDGTPRFIRTWPQDFDYLYLVGPPIENPIPSMLEDVFHASRFVLYRIHKRPG